MSDMDTVPGSSSTTESTDDGARSFTAIAKRPSVQIAEPPNSATNASKEKMRSKGQGGAASTAATVGSREAGNQADSTAGAPVKRSYSLSKHPLFQDKARGLRLRIMRFTPSWYSVTMVSAGLKARSLSRMPQIRRHPSNCTPALLIYPLPGSGHHADSCLPFQSSPRSSLSESSPE